jgi:dTDP-4-dehydrorhamnose reductase
MDIAPARADITACAVGRPSLDVLEPRSIERALADITPDVVINSAAYTAVNAAEDEPEQAFALNRDGARQLAHAAARRGIPIIHLSTDCVFDGSKTGPYTETDTPNPLSVYGQSKLAGEAAVREANPRHIILRTAWMFSPFGRNFVKTMLERASEGGPLRVVNDRHGSPTYVPHLVDAILAIAHKVKANNGGDVWGVYHAAGSGTATWYGMAAEILRHSALHGGPVAELEAITAAEYPSRAPHPANSQLDCSKLERVFGLRLPPWQDSIGECVTRLLTR